MKTIFLLAAVACGLGFSAAQSPRPAVAPDASAQCCTITENALRAYATVKLGSTREEVERNFELESMAMPSKAVYAFKKCPTIKFEAQFSLVDPAVNEFNRLDKITEFSHLYLEYAVKD
jgi:hypothetical protein